MFDVLTLSRIQFGLNSAFHYLYPPMSIGLGLFLVLFEGLYLWTKEEKYRRLTEFWIKIFALTFALGVATGLVQTFAFGTNWARYSRYVGDVFGSALAAEGIFAFFLEAGFLGVLLFGWDRVGPKLHYLSTILVALGAHFSAVWILVANSWMQTPAGHRIESTPMGDRAVVENFWEMVFNPSSLDRLTHVILGCWLTGVFFVLSVGAYYLWKKRWVEEATSMVRLALGIGAAVLLLQLVSGDRSAKLVAKYQPSKFAALEGVYRTQEGTPITVLGWVDAKEEKVRGVQIPGALSWITYGDAKAAVPGLDQIPKEEWPKVGVVFQTYHLMVMMWAMMFAMVVLGLWWQRKRRLHERRGLLFCMVGGVVLPHIANQAGWICAEVGRQPWIVWKLLRTEDGVSTAIRASQVAGSIGMFVMIYLLLFSLFLFLLDRKIRQGPEHVVGDSLYRNVEQ